MGLDRKNFLRTKNNPFLQFYEFCPQKNNNIIEAPFLRNRKQEDIKKIVISQNNVTKVILQKCQFH